MNRKKIIKELRDIIREEGSENILGISYREFIDKVIDLLKSDILKKGRRTVPLAVITLQGYEIFDLQLQLKKLKKQESGQRAIANGYRKFFETYVNGVGKEIDDSLPF